MLCSFQFNEEVLILISIYVNIGIHFKTVFLTRSTVFTFSHPKALHLRTCVRACVRACVHTYTGEMLCLNVRTLG